MTDAPLPPGSTGWLPWIGEGIGFLRDPFSFFRSRFERHGPVFRTKVFGNSIIALTGVEAFDLVNDDSRVTRVGAQPGFVERLFDPDCIPFLSGDAHELRRRFLRHALDPGSISSYQPLIRAVLSRYLEAWAGEGEVKATDAHGEAAFAIANVLFFGADSALDDNELYETFERYNKGFASIPINLPFTRYGKALSARDKLRRHVEERVEACADGDHALGQLIRAQRDGDAITARNLHIEVVHALTVAQQALRAGFIDVTRALAAHPDVLDRAREAARGGDRGYLDCVTREARRFYKILPATGLSKLIADTEFAGYRLPAGWKVAGLIHTTMRDAEHVERPDSFDPDRFAAGKPATYVAHGGGPESGHRCPGEGLADEILASYLELLLPNYTIELPEQDLTETRGGFAPMPKSGLRTRYRRLSGP